MVRVAPILLLLLVSACSAPGDPGPSEEGPTEPRDLVVERIASGSPGQGPQRPQVVVAPSAQALSEELGAKIPDSGGGTYLVAYRGEQPTGGYSVSAMEARAEGDRVTVRFSLKGPPPDVITTQVLTYPYEISVVKGLEPGGKEFSFVGGSGGDLDWPVRRVGG